MVRNRRNYYSAYKLDLNPLPPSINNTPFKPRIVYLNILEITEVDSISTLPTRPNHCRLIYANVS